MKFGMLIHIGSPKPSGY